MVDGAPTPIQTDFRHCIQVLRLMDNPAIDDRRRVDAVLLHCYGTNVPENKEGALKAALGFIERRENQTVAKKQNPSRKSERTLDWDIDQYHIIADFQREYHIDLTDPETHMHWWRFMALFDGLSDTSKIMTAIGYRSLRIPAKVSAEERNRLVKNKKHYALPPRSAEEVRQEDSALWGD